MVEYKKKAVKISRQFDIDIVDLFEYGEETFGFNSAKIFIGEIFNLILNLDTTWLLYPECRHLTTKTKSYRNIILGSYLIIYRVQPECIEVLKVISSRMSLKKIRQSRKIKI